MLPGRFILLETYRQNGQPVRTPLLFVEHQGILYMRTPAATAKVKRIRHNPAVRLAPCDLFGNVKGPWFEGQAALIPAAEAPWVNDLAKKRHRWFKRLIDLRNSLKNPEFVVIAVRLTSS
jgi:PPOX class probable F420-dependent enzyme